MRTSKGETQGHSKAFKRLHREDIIPGGNNVMQEIDVGNNILCPGMQYVKMALQCREFAPIL